MSANIAQSVTRLVHHKCRVDNNNIIFTLFVHINHFQHCFIHHYVIFKAFCRVVDSSLKTVSDLKKSIDSGVCIPQFGQQADDLCMTVMILSNDIVIH